MIYYKVVFYKNAVCSTDEEWGVRRIECITSRRNSRVMAAVDAALSPDRARFVLEGERFVSDLPIECIDELFVTDVKKFNILINRATESGAKIYEVSQDVMTRMSSAKSGHDVFAVVHYMPAPLPDRIVICDGVQDPGNVGTIIRSAAAFGFGCVISPDSANPYAPKVVQSSAGTVCTCYIARESAADAALRLKDDGYFIISSELDPCATTPGNIAYHDKLALIIGSEGRGVGAQASSAAHEKVYIPINNTDSLNAAVAAGILMYSFRHST